MKKQLLILFCLCGLICSTQGQTFRNYFAPNPYSYMASEDIQSITVTASGEIWIGSSTGGFSMYDGTTWQSYTTSNFPMTVNYINDILVDNQGTKWIATRGGGVIRFGTSIERYDINSEPAFLSNNILSVTQDHHGNLWFGTEGGGAIKWNGSSFSTLHTVNSGLRSNTVRKVLEDDNGILWFATLNGLSKLDGTTWYTYDSDNSEIRNYLIYDIALDHSGDLWLALGYSGVSKFNIDTEEFQYQEASKLISDGIYDIFETITVDKQNNVWAGTQHFGALKITGGNGQVYTKANSGLLSDNVNRVYADDQGRVWFGTTAGISILDANTWTVINKESTLPPGPNSNILVKNFIASNGDQWIISHPSNISKYDGTNWKHYNSGNLSFGNTNFTCITEDLQGRIWVGSSNNGLFYFDGTLWHNYSTSNSELQDNNISSLVCDKNGKLWIGGYQSGLISLVGGKFTLYPSMSNGLNAKNIKSLYVDRLNNIWVGTYDAGVFKFTGSAFVGYGPQSDFHGPALIFDITMDHSDNLWAATPTGLYSFNTVQESWRQYNIGNSPVIHNEINSVAVDADDNIWIGTRGGLSAFNGSGWVSFVTSGAAGLIDNDIRSIAVDEDNNKWLSTASHGLVELLNGPIDFNEQKNLFVKSGSNGDGSSFVNALGSLSQAIDLANSGDSIFVAAGTYQPAADSSFTMKAGVKILGGFTGTETTFAQRDLSLGHESILKGNGTTIILNIYNGLTASAVLDGFTLTGGTGEHSSSVARGGAMYNYEVAPVISHCIFKENTADIGGAVYNQQANPVFQECQFLDNSVGSFYNGGAVSETNSSCSYINCIFTGNKAGDVYGESGAGGAIDLYMASSSFYNCLFTDNKSLGAYDAGGGAISINTSWVNLYNCTFYGNTSTALLGTQVPQGNAISVDGYGTPNSQVRIMNSILYGSSDQQLYTFAPNNTTVEYSVIRGYSIDRNNDGVIDHHDYTDGIPFNTNPMFVNALAGDFRLKTVSPCIGVGTLFSYYFTDLDGNPRVVDGKIDLGAYQVKGLEFTVTPGQQLTSDRSDTTSSGMIYLYNSTENAVIVGVDPNGQNLGNIEATGSLSESYGSGTPTTLESPFGIDGEVHVLNRSWHVTLTNPDFNNPVTVQFFIDTTDLKDIISKMPENTVLPRTLEQWLDFAPLIQVYKVEGDDAYAANATNYKEYTFSEGNQTADLSHFRVGQHQQLFYLEFQVSEFSSGSVAYIPRATPIDLTAPFQGTLNSGLASFSWQTGNEVNIQHFELEKSLDNQSFTSIANIQPKGNNSTYIQSVNQMEATAYYRLKMVEQNGRIEYSSIVQLSQQQAEVSVYPNPASDYVIFRSTEAGTLYLFDQAGRLILSRTVVKGENRIATSALAAGIYHIRFNEQQLKFLKK